MIQDYQLRLDSNSWRLLSISKCATELKNVIVIDPNPSTPLVLPSS